MYLITWITTTTHLPTPEAELAMLADGLTTKWSPIQLAVWCRIAKIAGLDQRSKPLCYAANIAFIWIVLICM